MKFFTAKELAHLWGWHVGSLANQRCKNSKKKRTGPRFTRIGRTIVYYLSDVEAFEKKHPHLGKIRRLK